VDIRCRTYDTERIVNPRELVGRDIRTQCLKGKHS